MCRYQKPILLLNFLTDSITYLGNYLIKLFICSVSSSEKVDKANRYSDFNIISLPYPGCEFFKDFRDNNFNAEGLLFDWSRSQCNATINVPDNPHLAYLKIEWDNYKNWDLITMTQNYTKYMLKYFQVG